MIRELLASHPREFQSDNSTFERLVRAQHYGLPTRLLDVTRNPLVALYFACCEHSNETGQILIIDGPEEKRKFFDSDVVSCMSNLCFLSDSEKQAIIDKGSEIIDMTDGLLEKEGVDAHHDKCVEELNKDRTVRKLVHFIRTEKPAFQPNIFMMDLVRVVAVTPRKLHPRILAQDGAFLLFGLFPFDAKMNWMDDFKITSIDISGSAKARIISELRSIGVNQETLFPEIENSSRQIKQKYS